MFSLESFAKESDLNIIEESPTKAFIECPCERMESTLVYLKNHLGFNCLVGISSKENNLWYWLENVEQSFSLGVRTQLKSGEDAPSFSSVFHNAKYMEAELAETRNVKFQDRVDPLLRRPIDPFRTKTSVEMSHVDRSVHSIEWLPGPMNPLGEFGVILSTEDDIIEKCKLVNGLYNVNLEQSLDGKEVKSLVSSLRKFDGFDGFMWSALLYQALEEGMGINVPDKGQAIRMVFIEFSRILSHLEYIGNLSHALEAESLYYKVLDWSARLGKLQRQYTGNMLNLGVLAFGGAHREPPTNWTSTCLNTLETFSGEISWEIDKISKSVFWRRLVEIGRVDGGTLLNWGVTGPDLRASGINFDLRVKRPTYLYKEVDFEVPVGLGEGAFDRLMVRLVEMKQSIRIISQILDNLPTGDLVAKEAGHFSHFKIDGVKGHEDEYKKSVLGLPKLDNKIYQATTEMSSGVSTIAFSINELSVEALYLGSNLHGHFHCLENAVEKTAFDDLNVFMKSFGFKSKSFEK